MYPRPVYLLLLCAVCCANGARILGIFPSPSISHQLPFQAIMKALAARGHQITVISTDPLKTPVPNYTDVDLSDSYGHLRSAFDFEKLDQASVYSIFDEFISFGAFMTDQQFSSPQLQEFIRSNETKYDLVFLEALMYQSYYGLVHHVGSPPVIGILSLECLWTVAETTGTPTNPALVPEIMLSFQSPMTFFERLENTFFWLWMRYKIHTKAYPLQEGIMRKHFGSSPPPISVTEKNMSLLILSSNWMFNYPIPLMPSVVQTHSLHVKTTIDPLPKDLQKFLDEAEGGVIYFSLGSNVHSANIPEEKRQAFLEAFSELPQKVLWKWETDILPRQPENVKIGKWLPQQDILAHPNIKLFITQCGLQSFQEAVYHGVPMLGIPFMGDQKFNAKKIANLGIGLHLPFQEVTKETLLTSITALLHDSKYQNNMKKMSALSKDEPETALNRAVWWAEYVIRHNGAKHLRSSALDLPWYQYLLLDVAAFLLLIVVLVILMSYFIMKNIYMYLNAKSYNEKRKYD